MIIRFPQNTPPEKTYKWRYLTAFVCKIDEWEITDDVAFDIIDEMVRIAVRRGMIKKGLALLHADKLLIEACDNAKVAQETHASEMERFKQDYELVSNGDLMHKDNPKSLPNIVKWYMQGKLSRTYLATSKRCHEAMMQLKPIERAMLPNGKDLLSTRMMVNSKIPLKRQLKSVMGNDMRNGI